MLLRLVSFHGSRAAIASIITVIRGHERTPGGFYSIRRCPVVEARDPSPGPSPRQGGEPEALASGKSLSSHGRVADQREAGRGRHQSGVKGQQRADIGIAAVAEQAIEADLDMDRRRRNRQRDGGQVALAAEALALEATGDGAALTRGDCALLADRDAHCLHSTPHVASHESSSSQPGAWAHRGKYALLLSATLEGYTMRRGNLARMLASWGILGI